MFVRTGVPPHVMKRRLTSRETKEFFAYCERFPIDDFSNFQLPNAALQALIANVNRGPDQPAYSAKDFLLFRDADADLEEQLASGNW